MHAILQSISEGRSLRFVLLGLLVAAFCFASVGCSGVGSNGGPAAPSNLSATSGDSEVSLSWDAVDAAETYNVYRSTSSTDGAGGDPIKSGVSSPSYTDATAENGTAYYYRVTAVDSEGNESGASGEVQKTPFSGPPDRP